MEFAMRATNVLVTRLRLANLQAALPWSQLETTELHDFLRQDLHSGVALLRSLPRQC